MRPNETRMDGPLAGKTILDCSILLPGPLVGKLLAELGARVLKVESPSRPDPARQMGAAYEDLNSLKETIALDLVVDRARFHELVARADGLIEAFRPKAKEKLGLTASALHAVNPRLAIASLVGYPEGGTLRDRAGHDLNFSARAGAVALFGGMPALPLADLFGAHRAALALTASILEGKGRRVAVSLFDSIREAQSTLVADFRASGLAPEPGTTLYSGVLPCYRLYQAKCGRRVAVGALEPKFWVAVTRILGCPDLSEEGYAQGARGGEVGARIQSAFKSRTWSEWAPLFEGADCCVEPVLGYAEADECECFDISGGRSKSPPRESAPR